MTELIRNARLGWVRFITDGKLAALFFAALLFLWLCRGKEIKKSFLLYASVAAGCCVLPFTAVLLMLYQTKFYDYEWVWSLVPFTAVIAYGVAELLTGYWKDFKSGGWRKGLTLVLLLLGVFLLCRGPVNSESNRSREAEERKRASVLLEQLAEASGDVQLCLWAPQNVLEYARELDGGIQLVYGRNMWDISLNAYAYDVYDQSVIDLYRWMSAVEESERENTKPESGVVTAVQCAETVRLKDVNCILLPETAAAEKIADLERALGTESVRLEGYYLFLL